MKTESGCWEKKSSILILKMDKVVKEFIKRDIYENSSYLFRGVQIQTNPKKIANRLKRIKNWKKMIRCVWIEFWIDFSKLIKLNLTACVYFCTYLFFISMIRCVNLLLVFICFNHNWSSSFCNIDRLYVLSNLLFISTFIILIKNIICNLDIQKFDPDPNSTAWNWIG